MTSDPIRSMVEAYATTKNFRVIVGAIVGDDEDGNIPRAHFRSSQYVDTLVAGLSEKKPLITPADDGFVRIVFERSGLGQIEFLYKDTPRPELYPVVNYMPLNRMIPRNKTLRSV